MSYELRSYATNLAPNFAFIARHVEALGVSGCRRYVELGVWQGESLRFMGELCRSLGYATVCYGIDTFRGDSFAGTPLIAGEPWQAARAIREQCPPNTVVLAHTFDQAAEYFDNDSIDVLLIDGDHRYESVKHDYLTWRPKVRPGGLIFLHDIDVTTPHYPPFGVKRFWSELEQVERAEADHVGCGLGLILR